MARARGLTGGGSLDNSGRNNWIKKLDREAILLLRYSAGGHPLLIVPPPNLDSRAHLIIGAIYNERDALRLTFHPLRTKFASRMQMIRKYRENSIVIFSSIGFFVRSEETHRSLRQRDTLSIGYVSVCNSLLKLRLSQEEELLEGRLRTTITLSTAFSSTAISLTREHSAQSAARNLHI